MRTTILAAKPVANISAAAAPITILKCIYNEIMLMNRKIKNIRISQVLTQKLLLTAERTSSS